jgi:hypothetical protein
MYNSRSNNNVTLDEKLTKQLVGRIYAETDLSKFRYDMLNYEGDLQKILKNKYFVSTNFCGTNCLLVFTKVLDKFYSFTVDRQTLSYNFSKVDFSKVKLNLVNIGLDDLIYNGTIFEGILVKRHNMDDVYVISDVYKFCGKDVTKDKLNFKLLSVVGYLRNNYDKDMGSNNLELEVNKLFELDKFDHFVDDILPKIKHRKYRGICFYPEISETKLIFNMMDFKPINNQNNGYQNNGYQNNGNQNNYKQVQRFNQNDKEEFKSEFKSEEQQHKVKLENNSVKLETKSEYKEDDKKTKYINETNEDVFAILDMKQTDNPDVYKLYCVEKEVQNKKTVLKKVSCGIAHIRGINMSHMVKKLFENKKTLLMKCKFNNDISKWEPIEQEKTQKIPTLLSEIESKLVIMELSDDE